MKRKDLERLLTEGKIKGYVDVSDRSVTCVDKSKKYKHIKLPSAESKELTWLRWQLWYWCGNKNYTLLTEYKFHGERKWRFDFAIKELKVAVEYEGLMSEKSRHLTKTGYTGDTEKYTQAAMLGWKVLRYTAINYKNIIGDLEKLKTES